MPRRLRTGTGGHIFHVLNRSVGRRTLFPDDADYALLLATLREAQTEHPIRLLNYCIMPNHWHFVLWPRDDTDMSRFMHWFTATHTRRVHLRNGTTGTGPIYQGRYKSFPVETNRYLLNLMRYAERNAQASGLVDRARDWRWSSLWQRIHQPALGAIVCPSPIEYPENWIDLVERDLHKATADEIRHSIRRGTPLGSQRWRDDVARTLGLEASLRNPGRPRKAD